MGIRRSEYQTFPCECCGFWTLRDPANGSYEICPVCFWEDDPIQNGDPHYAGGANEVSLAVARQNYIDLGASEARFLPSVRPPKLQEFPPSLSSPDPQKQRAMRRGLTSAIISTAQSILAGQVEVIEGCFTIAWLAYGLDESERRLESLTTFEMIASELDDIPLGEYRNLWDPKALEQKDSEASAYINRVLPQVLEACRNVEVQLSSGG